MPGPLDDMREDPGILWREFVDWMTRPSFGSHTKRATELKLFELLYRARFAEGPVSVARVAEELTTTRSPPRTLLPEGRVIVAAAPDPIPRRDVLARFVKQWPRHGRIEQDG